MDILEYLNQIDYISNNLIFTLDNYNINEPFKIDAQMLDDLRNLTEIKKEIITDEEQRRANIVHIKPIMELDMDNEMKLLLTAVYIEVLNNVRKKEFIKSVEKYDIQQPIFKEKNLFSHVRDCKELIDYDILKWIKQSNICKYGEKFLEASSFIREELSQFLFQKCTKYKKYIRIHPYVCFDKIPMMIIQEEALRPIDPDWIKTLKLYRGQSTGGHYFLPNMDVEDIKDDYTKLKWWEYSVLKIRSLEVHAQRSNKGNLSMMIEEINEEKIYNEYYIAKCIHLDTDNDAGTDIDSAVLAHIDLAINVYDVNAYSERKSQSLANGRVVDATIRTHLLRFENVPFRILINLVNLFFDSQVLTTEWIMAQFSNSQGGFEGVQEIQI